MDEIHTFSVGSRTFKFRPLTIDEITLLIESTGDSDIEDELVRRVTLEPAGFDFDELKAGHFDQYSEAILKGSNYDLKEIAELLETQREKTANSIIFKMQSYIITAMPAYKVEDLKGLSMRELIRLNVLAEDIITTQQQLAGIESTGFKLVITKAGGEPVAKSRPQANQAQQPTPNPVTKTGKLSKEDEDRIRKVLINQIRESNLEAADPKDVYGQRDIAEIAEEFSIDQLKAIAGKPKDNDPVNSKLAANQREVRHILDTMFR